MHLPESSWNRLPLISWRRQFLKLWIWKASGFCSNQRRRNDGNLAILHHEHAVVGSSTEEHDLTMILAITSWTFSDIQMFTSNLSDPGQPLAATRASGSFSNLPLKMQLFSLSRSNRSASANWLTSRWITSVASWPSSSGNRMWSSGTREPVLDNWASSQWKVGRDSTLVAASIWTFTWHFRF